MSDSSGVALCGKCAVPLQGPEEPKDDSEFSCPECGRSDTYANVLDEIGNYMRDQAARQLDAMMDDAFSGSKIVTVTSKFDPPQREYRFITDATIKI